MLKKMLAIIAVALIFSSVATGSFYLSWKHALAAELEAGSIVADTALGEVEYTLTGSGPVMVVLHGTPGGYDQVSSASGALPDYVPKNVTLLAISRPGYLRTPLSSGKTPEAQADLLAALLEKLEIADVTVVGVSGGGPAALQFALRHSDKTRSLILLSARTKSHPDDSDDDEPSAIDRIRAVVGTDFLIWLLEDRIATSLAGDVKVDENIRARLKSVVRSSALIEQRRLGRANDVANLTDPRLDGWPLHDVSVPTLILYGDKDTGVSPEESVYASERIEHSKLVNLPAGHFVAATHPDRVRFEIETFLRD